MKRVYPTMAKTSPKVHSSILKHGTKEHFIVYPNQTQGITKDDHNPRASMKLTVMLKEAQQSTSIVLSLVHIIIFELQYRR